MRFAPAFSTVFSFLILFALWPGPARAQGTEESFKVGVAAFQKNDLAKARLAFQNSLASDPMNPVVLFNLGLVEQKAGKLGLALGLWRKALVIDPSHDPAAHAIAWTRPKLERQEIPHDVDLWENFRAVALDKFALKDFVFATALLFFASGWLLLRYFGARRRALLDEQPLPPLPTVAITLSGLLVLSAALSAAKGWDGQVVRATIVVKKVEVRSTPDANGTSLFDLYEGLEVVVRQNTDDWMQVTYPGGPTGWLPKAAAFSTADNPPMALEGEGVR